MAAPNVRNILMLPGELIKDPTDLTTDAPYGGTRLGLVRDLYFRPQAEHHVIRAEEWGNAPVDVVYGGTSTVFAASLREFDNDAIQAIFLDTATGSPSGDQVISFRATSGRAGTLVSTKEMILLFVPKAALRHPSMIIRAALPVLADDAEIVLGQSAEMILRVVFYARPDSSNRLAVIGKLKDLSL